MFRKEKFLYIPKPLRRLLNITVTLKYPRKKPIENYIIIITSLLAETK